MSPELAVVWVVLVVGGLGGSGLQRPFRLRRPLISGRRNDEAMDVTEAEPAADELRGQPVEQLRLCGLAGLMAEIAGLAVKPFAEVPLPKPVHRHPGEQGVFGRGEPVGERFDAPFPEVDGAAREGPSRPDRPICFGPARIGAGQYVALFTGPLRVGFNGVEHGDDRGIGAPDCLRQVVDPASQIAVLLAEVFGEHLVDLVAINSEDGEVIVGDLLLFDAASAFRLADHRLDF